MGTEQVRSLNPEIASVHNKHDAVNSRFLQEKIETRFIQLQATMDRLLEQFNRDSERKTILHQEETFRQQVKELHRLYQVQKMLMAELRRKELHSSSACSIQVLASEAQSSCWGPYGNPQSSYDFCGRSTMGDHHQEGQGEPSSSYHGVFDIERPAPKDVCTFISSIDRQTASSGKMPCTRLQNKRICSLEESDIDLTLSIGSGTSNKSSIKTRQHNPTVFSVGIDQEEARRDPKTNCDRESLQKPPHWPFRALSLNKT